MKSNTRTKMFTIPMTPEEYERLGILAARHHMTKCGYYRIHLLNLIEREERKSIRKEIKALEAMGITHPELNPRIRLNQVPIQES